MNPFSCDIPFFNRFLIFAYHIILKAQRIAQKVVLFYSSLFDMLLYIQMYFICLYIEYKYILITIYKDCKLRNLIKF